MLPTTIKNRNFVASSLIDELLSDNFLSGLFSTDRSTGRSFPAINVKESDQEFLLELAAPGLSKEDLKVSVEDGVLTVSSEKEELKEDSKVGFIRKEFAFISFSRSFNLPENSDTEKISASHKNGVLQLIIPKIKEFVTPPKEIEIS